MEANFRKSAACPRTRHSQDTQAIRKIAGKAHSLSENCTFLLSGSFCCSGSCLEASRGSKSENQKILLSLSDASIQPISSLPKFLWNRGPETGLAPVMYLRFYQRTCFSNFPKFSTVSNCNWKILHLDEIPEMVNIVDGFQFRNNPPPRPSALTALFKVLLRRVRRPLASKRPPALLSFFSLTFSMKRKAALSVSYTFIYSYGKHFCTSSYNFVRRL